MPRLCEAGARWDNETMLDMLSLNGESQPQFQSCSSQMIFESYIPLFMLRWVLGFCPKLMFIHVAQVQNIFEGANRHLSM